jgi:hypothetical protein
MNKTRFEILALSFLSGGALLFLYLSYHLPTEGFSGGIGPQSFPRGAFILMLVLNFFLFVRVFRGIGKGSFNIRMLFPSIPLRTIFFLCLVIAYVAVWDSVGFFISSAVFIFLAAYIFAPSGKRSLSAALALSIGFTSCIHILFVYVFKIPLPAGLLERIL